VDASAKRGWKGVSWVLVVAIGLLLPGVTASYERWTDGCDSCHGGFRSSGYVSAGTGVAWPDTLHNVHRSQSWMATDCNLCHLGGGYDHTLSSSNGTGSTPGHGCLGCHGASRVGGPPTGDGLRRHHVESGAAACTTSCHPSAAPAREGVAPPYYGSPDTAVAEPCNTPLGLEDWNGDGQGLDLDCQPGVVNWDDFASGDTSFWSAQTP
jgi:hypothetical protein